jgi:hypothetical protein
MSMPNADIYQRPFTMYAKCVDATELRHPTDMWIEEGAVYIVRGIEDDEDPTRLLIEDRNGVHIKPSADVDTFRTTRFKLHIIGNN